MRHCFVGNVPDIMFDLTSDCEVDRSSVSAMHVGHTDMVAPGVPVPHPPHCQPADVAVLQLGVAHQVSSGL